MKILYVTTIACTMNFFKSYIGELIEADNTVDLACNCDDAVDEYFNRLGCKIHNIPFSRNPFSKSNLKGFKALKRLISLGGYDIVHCHTPVAAMCTRLACAGLRKKGIKVFYTAHGFHFYKGAPLKNWLIYYPVEKICAHFTDLLITINQEDYAFAQRKMKAKKIEYVPGVGINTEEFKNHELTEKEKAELRKAISVPEDATLLFSVGELNENKNHKVVLNALSLIKEKNIHYVIAGEGSMQEYLTSLARQLKLEDNFHLLGYRKDVKSLYKIADYFVHPSFREGLPVSVMEAIAAGLPIIASNIRGNKDLVDDSVGCLFNPNDSNDFCRAFNTLEKKMLSNNLNITEKAIKFDKKIINKQMYSLYEEVGKQ